MTGNTVELVAKGISFFSAVDEDAFFYWLGKIEAIESYKGIKDSLHIVVLSNVDDISLRELIALFYRYDIELKQLLHFQNKKNKRWLFNSNAYWFERLVSHPVHRPPERDPEP